MSILARMAKTIAAADAVGAVVGRFLLSDEDYAAAVREIRAEDKYDDIFIALDGFKYDGVDVTFGRPGDASEAFVYRGLQRVHQGEL